MKNSPISDEGSSFEELIEVLMAEAMLTEPDLPDESSEPEVMIDVQTAPEDLQEWRKRNDRSKRQRK
jgi:hypothetical protein